jgi:hypothetical protein
MSEFKNNYEMMADSLQVMNKRLYLLNPKYVAQQQGIDIVDEPVDPNNTQPLPEPGEPKMEEEAEGEDMEGEDEVLETDAQKLDERREEL